MTPDTFMNISQQSELESSPNKRGGDERRPLILQRLGVTSALWARLFSAEVSLGGFTSSYNWKCRNRIYSGFKNHKVGSEGKKNSGLKQTDVDSESRPCSYCDSDGLKKLLFFSGPLAFSHQRSSGQLTFPLIIVVCDISKRIRRMKCDKNYFHVTPEHLTSDGPVQRSTRAQTSLRASWAVQRSVSGLSAGKVITEHGEKI